jgi:hypothetical protein
MPGPTRRAVLKTGGAALVGTALAGRVLAEHGTFQPEHVTIDFPTDMMDQYRPALDLSAVDPDDILGLYGWRATSPEYEYDYYVFWVRWSHQEGIAPAGVDSHYLDHEPVLVGVAPDTGTVDYLAYSGYHWLKAQAVGESIPLDEDHPLLYVFSPWHHYRIAPEATGSLLEVQDLRDGYNAWIANQLEEDLVPGASYNPAILGPGGQSDWWRSNEAGISLNALLVRAYLTVGVNNAGRTDLAEQQDLLPDWLPLSAGGLIRWAAHDGVATSPRLPAPTAVLDEVNP